MYRDNYSEQPLSSSLPNIQNINTPSIPSYDYRNSSYMYKPPQNIMSQPNHQTHGMYYDSQQQMTQPQMQPNPYMNTMGTMNNMNMNMTQVPMQNMQVQGMEQTYQPPRYYWRDIDHKISDNYPPSLPTHPPATYTPQLNVVQRISNLIKSQLPMLQAIMSQVPSKYNSRVQLPSKRHHSRSRSRSKERNRKNSDSSHDWLCRKCSFSNFDWRDNCKKCNEPRPSRSFVPGPQDWKCPKCGNINYARRQECNRCKRPKSGGD